ncbi:MAG: Ada metal-binding domain-containing protein [Sphingobacteriales bacterium]
MINHSDLGDTSFRRSRMLKELIDKGEVLLGGNKNLQIYGTLGCASGKRMKTKNRVFFKSELEAKQAGYRPCGHCMKAAYLQWKVLSLIFAR